MAEDNKLPDDLIPADLVPAEQPQDLQSTQELSPFQKLLAAAQGPVKTYSDYMKNVMNTGTLGLEPKAEAGLRAIIGKLRGETEETPAINIPNKQFGDVNIPAGQQPASLQDLYNKYKALGQQDLAQTNQTSPTAAMAGRVAGTLPVAAAVTATGAPELAGALAEGLVPAVANTAIRAVAPEAMTTLANAGIPGALGSLAGAATEGAVVGGGINAVQGEDIGEGLKTGALLGGGLNAAGQIGSAVIQKTAQIAEPYIQGIPYLRQLRQAVKGGDSAVTDEARTALKAQESQMADELSQNMMNGKDILGKNIDNTIQDASRKGITVSLDQGNVGVLKKFLMDNRTRMAPQDFKQLFNQLATFDSEDAINPQELNDFRKQLQNATSHFTDPSIVDTRNAILKGISQNLDAIPGYKEANAIYHDYNQSLPETLLNAGSSNPKYLSQFQDPQAAFKEKLQDLFQKIGFRTEPGTDALETLNDIKTKLIDFNNMYPGKLEELGIDPEKYIKLIKDQGDLSALRIRQTGEGLGGIQGITSALVNAPMSVAPILSKGVKAGGAALSRLKYATPDDLTAAGTKLQSDPQLKDLGDQLINSIKTNNDFLKNAAIFKILQNPKAKEVLGQDNQ
jgi:gas vesicle protein